MGPLPEHSVRTKVRAIRDSLREADQAFLPEAKADENAGGADIP